jgi:hypothetical protein
MKADRIEPSGRARVTGPGEAAFFLAAGARIR